MQKTLISFLFVSILGLAIACSNNRNSTNLKSWAGKYNYGEEPIKAIAGYNMMMIWELSISNKNDTCQGILEVNGQQTYIKLLTDISGDTNSIALTYNKLIDGSDENLKKGDTLFLLLKEGNKIKTRWMSLIPRLPENPPMECRCFELEQKNGH